jgi:hypothetical protein
MGPVVNKGDGPQTRRPRMVREMSSRSDQSARRIDLNDDDFRARATLVSLRQTHRANSR